MRRSPTLAFGPLEIRAGRPRSFLLPGNPNLAPHSGEKPPQRFDGLGAFPRAGAVLGLAVARATFIKSSADSTVIRAYRVSGPWGTPMDIAERFYIAAAALGFLLIAAMGLLG
jgi:hypothetical protein